MCCAFNRVAVTGDPGFLKNKKVKYYLIQSFVRQHFFRLCTVIGLGVANSLAGIILLLSVGKYLEIVFTSGSAKSKALSWLGIHLTNELSHFFFFFFLVAAVKFFCSWAEKYYTSVTSTLLLARARKQYFQYLLHETERKAVPKQLVWFSGELKALQSYFEKGVIGFIKDVFFFLVCLYLLMRFSLTPAFLLVFIVILLFTLGRYGHKPLKKIIIDQRKKTSGLLSFISVRLHALNDIQQTNAENKVYFQFLRRQQNVLCAQYKVRFYKTLISSLVPFLLFCTLGFFMWLIAQTDLTSIPPADATGFILLLLNLFAPIRRILKVDSVLLPGRVCLNKLEVAYRKLMDIFTEEAKAAATFINPVVQKII